MEDGKNWMRNEIMRGHEPRSTSSCAACKFLKRKCIPNCLFAPYFHSDEPKKFAKVHKVFGASNVSKILTEVPEEQREDTVNSLAYEAEARLRDPVYGCIGAIILLQRKMLELQQDLAVARARLARYTAANSCTIQNGHHVVMLTGFSDFVAGDGLIESSSHNSSEFNMWEKKLIVIESSSDKMPKESEEADRRRTSNNLITVDCGKMKAHQIVGYKECCNPHQWPELVARRIRRFLEIQRGL